MVYGSHYQLTPIATTLDEFIAYFRNEIDNNNRGGSVTPLNSTDMLALLLAIQKATGEDRIVVDGNLDS